MVPAGRGSRRRRETRRAGSLLRGGVRRAPPHPRCAWPKNLPENPHVAFCFYRSLTHTNPRRVDSTSLRPPRKLRHWAFRAAGRYAAPPPKRRQGPCSLRGREPFYIRLRRSFEVLGQTASGARAAAGRAGGGGRRHERERAGRPCRKGVSAHLGKRRRSRPGGRAGSPPGAPSPALPVDSRRKRPLRLASGTPTSRGSRPRSPAAPPPGCGLHVRPRAAIRQRTAGCPGRRSPTSGGPFGTAARSKTATREELATAWEDLGLVHAPGASRRPVFRGSGGVSHGLGGVSCGLGGIWEHRDPATWGNAAGEPRRRAARGGGSSQTANYGPSEGSPCVRGGSRPPKGPQRTAAPPALAARSPPPATREPPHAPRSAHRRRAPNPSAAAPPTRPRPAAPRRPPRSAAARRRRRPVPPPAREPRPPRGRAATRHSRNSALTW